MAFFFQSLSESVGVGVWNQISKSKIKIDASVNCEFDVTTLVSQGFKSLE